MISAVNLIGSRKKEVSAPVSSTFPSSSSFSFFVVLEVDRWWVIVVVVVVVVGV